MSTLYIVRHGQASFLTRDYDRLSELGTRQAQLLGEWWARRGIVPTHVVVGPRRRHRETWAAAQQAHVAHSRTPWPEPHFDDAWDEYQFGALLQADMTALIAADPALSAVASQLLADSDNRARHFQKLFEALTLRWVRGEIALPDVETWRHFRDRVESAAAALIERAPTGATVVAFTSGGPVAAATAMLLGLSDDKTMELSWMVRNAAFSEIRFRDDRRSLVAFGALPHLNETALETWR